MKALVLAGGRGTRLRPITHTSAKQLVPVANKPVLFYGLEAIRDAGIRQVGIVVAAPGNLQLTDRRGAASLSPMVNSQEAIKEAVGDGSAFNLEVTYIEQHAPLGLAHAVKISRQYLGDEPFVMYLGDNLILGGITPFVREFEQELPDAQILLARVKNPQDFGVAELKGNRVVGLEEKPKVPKSDLALVGVYLFNARVFEAVNAIQPSKRGELEITDAIQYLITHGRTVRSHVIEGWWKDTGQVEDLLEANRIMVGALKMDVRIKPDGESSIEGDVVIKENTTIARSRLRGPLIIGRDCHIEDSYVGPYTALGDGVRLDHAEIENSIVLERSAILDVPTRIESSLIGKDVVVRSSNHRPRAHRIVVGDSSEIELG